LTLLIHNFIFGLDLGLDLNKLASASASGPSDPGLGLGLEILASLNITDMRQYMAAH